MPYLAEALMVRCPPYVVQVRLGDKMQGVEAVTEIAKM